MEEKNINDLLDINYYINENYRELDLNNEEDMMKVSCNDVLVIQLISTNNILKVYYTGQDNKYIFVCSTKEENGYISLLTNKFSYKILKNNIKIIYRRNNMKYNHELTFLYEKILNLEKKIDKLENKLDSVNQ
jgi:hypothetical protein